MEKGKIGKLLFKLIIILTTILLVEIINTSRVNAAQTLTIDPNSGTWEGLVGVQNFKQEANTTKDIVNPIGPTGFIVNIDYNGGTGSVSTLVQSSNQNFNSWTYTFGNNTSKLTANYTGNPILLPKATKDGYKCVGWYTSIEGGTRVGNSGEEYTPIQDITLYARWEKDPQHTVTYNANGGTGAPANQTKIFGVNLLLSSEIPVKNGYSFCGWSTELNGKIVQYKPKDKYNKEENITLYAIWEKEKVLEINPNGGTWQDSSEIQTFSGTTNSTKYVYNPSPSNGVKVNYDYNGGMPDPSNIAENTTKDFESWNYTFGDNKSTLTANYSQEGVVLPGAILTGYKFIGWYTSASGGTKVGDAGNTYTPTVETTLYARWQQDTDVSTPGTNDGTGQYTITYNANGGIGAPETQKKKVGVPLEISYETPTKEGAYFKGWATEAYSNKVEYNIGDLYEKDENITLYAVWSSSLQTLILDPGDGTIDGSGGIKTYTKEIYETQDVNNPEIFKDSTITFNYNGGVGEETVKVQTSEFESWDYKFGNMESTMKAVYSKNSIELPSTEKEGYDFEGWYTEPEGGIRVGGIGDEYYADEDIELYAHWEEKNYEIVYDANGGEGAPNPQIKQYGIDIEISEIIPTRDGYTFIGWSTLATSSITEYEAGATYSLEGNKTLYAVWIAFDYEVKYDANGGQGAPLSQVKKHGVELELSKDVPIREGYSFKGWSLDANGTKGEYEAGAKYTLEGNRILYAIWDEIIYEITYNANGGEAAPGKQIKQHGVSLILSSSIPQKEGFSFKGWATSVEAEVYDYLPGENYNLNESKILYAIWQKEVKVTYEVIYDANGGEGAPDPQTKIQGTDMIITSQEPTKEGHTFIGWSENPTSEIGEYKANEKYAKDETVILYAIWKGKTYTITYNANGGQGAPDPQTKIYGSILEITRNEPSRDKYIFMGWSRSASATMTQYKPGQVYYGNENIELYAVWLKNTTTIPIKIGPGIEAGIDDSNDDLKYTYGIGYVDNINVGLKRRKEIDIEIGMEIEDVELVINGKSQKYTSNFSNLTMYGSDINQNGISEEKQLKAIIKYKVNLKNQTPDFKVRINELANYFSNGLEVYDVYGASGAKYNYTENSKYGEVQTYSGYVNNYISEQITLDANESATFYLELLADREYISSHLGDNTENIIEINSFTTFHPNPKYVYYPGVDKDSMPGTAIPGNATTYEDDTSSSTMVFKNNGLNRDTTGSVFVDSTPDEFLSGQERKGDGILKEGEFGVEGVTVLLEEVSGTGLEYETTTDAFGDFTILGYIPGEYVIKYIYGNEPYNTYDFKSTLYEQNKYTNKYWYNSLGTRYSDAVDSWEIRRKIDAKEETIMTATTAQMAIEIETAKLRELDFGIVERARDKVSLNKEISNIKITLSNGSILLNGNPAEVRLPNTKYVKPQLKTEEDRLNRTNIFAKGTVWTEMDKEYMQGASIEIQYKINAKNLGEIDYYTEDYYKYYIKGTDSQQIKTSIDSIVDYVDNNLKYEDSINGVWDEISEENKKKLEDETKDYYNTIVYTEALKKSLEVLEQSGDIDITLTQMISSETGEMEYENIAEIFSASSTRGYTRFSDMGVRNFNPNKTVLETDECEADEVIITTPTGENVVLPGIIIIVTFTIIIIGGIVAMYVVRKKVTN